MQNEKGTGSNRQNIVIDTTKIPPVETRLLAATVCEAAKRFYQDPEHVAQFKAWQAEREANGST